MNAAVPEFELHRNALMGHCYRMMGSVVDADDAVQETLVRAWKSFDRFDGRASLRTWLYKIATHVCLSMLENRTRRGRPVESGPVGTPDDVLHTLPRTHWLEPVPDALALPADSDPSEMLVMRQSIRLAFVAALQHLPPKQRAVLLMSEVLGWAAAEIAETLETSVASVNSALQRARATLSERSVATKEAPLSPEQSKLLEKYVDAFLRYDVDALVALLHEDATLSMPPFTLWLQGHDVIKRWLLGPGLGCRHSRIIPTSACGVPAYGQYRPGGPGGTFTPWAILMVELREDRIVAMNSFLDTETLFPKFGLPAFLPAK